MIDLRTQLEVSERGSYRDVSAEVAQDHLPMIDVLPDADELPACVDPAVVAARYREMLETGRDAIAETLAIPSHSGGYPSMFHCSADKDRTGVVAAVLLGALDVPDATIGADDTPSAAATHRLVTHLRGRYPDAAARLERIAPAMSPPNPRRCAGSSRVYAPTTAPSPGTSRHSELRCTLTYVRASLLTDRTAIGASSLPR